MCPLLICCCSSPSLPFLPVCGARTRAGSVTIPLYLVALLALPVEGSGGYCTAVQEQEKAQQEKGSYLPVLVCFVCFLPLWLFCGRGQGGGHTHLKFQQCPHRQPLWSPQSPVFASRENSITPVGSFSTTLSSAPVDGSRPASPACNPSKNFCAIH